MYEKLPNQGLPPLDKASKAISSFEFWPAWFFYIPIVIYWIALSIRYRNFGLPMAVNPAIELGGMIGESKVEILQLGGDIASQFILPFVVGQIDDPVLQKCDDSLMRYAENEVLRASEKGVEFPFVIKPEHGCRGAGVQCIDNAEQLSEYLAEFPTDRRYMIQQLAPYAAEAGIFYERVPWEPHGRVTSITLKYRPYVVGDGVSTLRSLICRDHRASVLRRLYFEKNWDQLSVIPQKGQVKTLAFAGSHCRGSIFRDGGRFITDALSESIDRIMQDFPHFHYGRLDIKFKDIESLKRGDMFYIIEINGVSSEKTHIWDSETPLWRAFSTLFEQYGTLFKMGRFMVSQGIEAPSARTLISSWLSELRRGNRYPNTH